MARTMNSDRPATKARAEAMRDAGDTWPFTLDQLANARRMDEMGLTDHEAQQVVGALAGCSHMAAALDAVVKRREGKAA